MKKIITGVIIIILAVIGIFYFSKNSNQPTINIKEPIKIGVLIPTTGLAAAIGDDNRQGLDLAKEDLLEKYPDLKLELVYEDTAYDPKVAVTAYFKLRDVNKVGVIISGGTKISGPLRKVAQLDNILQMAIWSAAPSYSEIHDLNYRTTPLSDDNVPVLVDYLKKNGYKKLAVFYPIDEFGITYKESFEKLAPLGGIEIVDIEGYLATDKDFRGSLSKIKNKKPDALFVAGTAPQLGVLFKQIKELGIVVNLLSQGAAENKQMLDGAAGAAEGLVYSYYFDPSSQYSASFSNKYLSRYGKVPSQYVAEAYTGLTLIGEAINSCDNKLEKNCWKDYLDKFRNSPTVLGLASINERGDLKPDKVFLKEVKNGKFVKLEE